MKKKCCKCEKDKDLKFFSKKKSAKDGYNSSCKECHSEYRKEHYKKNKEKVFEQVNEYKKDNPEKYVKKFANRKPNLKAGRKFKIKCSNPECDIDIYISLKDIENNIYRYCCRECKNWNYDPINRYISDIKKRAIKKNFEFDLDFRFLKNLLVVEQNNKCAITNVDIEFTSETVLYKTPSLDRINNDKGYTKDNVQWVMLGINYMKMNFSDEDLRKTLDLIIENYK